MIVSTQRSKSGPRRAERPGSFWSLWMVSTVTSMARRWLQRCCGAWRRKWCLGCSVPPIPTMTESLSYLVTRGPTFKFHSDTGPKITMYSFMCYFSKLEHIAHYEAKNQHTHTHTHTPSTVFRHLPPNSARFSYATERALFISTQLSCDVVTTLEKVWVLIRLWKQPSTQART